MFRCCYSTRVTTLFQCVYIGGGDIQWAFVMILSTVPMTLSSVYKEIALGTTEVDAVGGSVVYNLLCANWKCFATCIQLLLECMLECTYSSSVVEFTIIFLSSVAYA